MRKNIIGIDIGGTHFRIGAVTGNGRVEDFRKLPTRRVMTSADVLSDLAAFIAGYCKGMDVEAVSIGFPAALDRARQTVLQAPNLPFMENLPVVAFLSNRLGVPVFAERDVTMALCYDMAKYCIPGEGITCGFYFGTALGTRSVSMDGRFSGKTVRPGSWAIFPWMVASFPAGAEMWAAWKTSREANTLPGCKKSIFRIPP